MEVHPDMAPVAWLLGTWVGHGSGWYPTIADFAYREEAVWGHGGKPLLAYTQRTWALDDGRPLHGEAGYLRVAGGALELVIAHANGIVEVSTGPLAEVIELTSVSVVSSPAAKSVTSLSRRIWLDGSALRYELGMAAVGVDHQGHLGAELHRT
ncbi:MAG: heme-binding beta-barrel domain-containing protein [Acidimicrobiales bacterium]